MLAAAGQALPEAEWALGAAQDASPARGKNGAESPDEALFAGAKGPISSQTGQGSLTMAELAALQPERAEDDEPPLDLDAWGEELPREKGFSGPERLLTLPDEAFPVPEPPSPSRLRGGAQSPEETYSLAARGDVPLDAEALQELMARAKVFFAGDDTNE